jgi:hypothetical protein
MITFFYNIKNKTQSIIRYRKLLRKAKEKVKELAEFSFNVYSSRSCLPSYYKPDYNYYLWFRKRYCFQNESEFFPDDDFSSYSKRNLLIFMCDYEDGLFKRLEDYITQYYITQEQNKKKETEKEQKSFSKNE